MKNGLKKFVKNLPGPESYCHCLIRCSPIQIEHVFPQKILPKQKRILNDPHNLYTCCAAINKEKGPKLFGRDFILDNTKCDHQGALARSCLYMYDTYELDNIVDGKTVALWKVLDEIYEPLDFEYERNEMIFDYNGTWNHYIHTFEFYKDKLF